MPADPGTLALGIATISMSFSALALIRRQGGTKQPKSEHQCPCRHGINFHEKLVGHCQVVLSREPIKWRATPNGMSKPIEWEPFLCDCQVYTGPELIRSLADLDRLSLPKSPRSKDDKKT